MSVDTEEQTKITNLENDVSTLQGENDRLNSELLLKEKYIQELQQTQKSLEDQVKACNINPEEFEKLKNDKEKQSLHIIDLENKLKEYQNFESARITMQKQLEAIEEKSNLQLKELVETKASHEMEVKELKERIMKLSQEEGEYNSDFDQLVQIKIVIEVKKFEFRFCTIF